MKTELRLVPHTVVPGAQAIEIWHDGVFLGTVTGADGPGVRVISKHDMSITVSTVLKIQPVYVTEVRINQ